MKKQQILHFILYIVYLLVALADILLGNDLERWAMIHFNMLPSLLFHTAVWIVFTVIVIVRTHLLRATAEKQRALLHTLLLIISVCLIVATYGMGEWSAPLVVLCAENLCTVGYVIGRMHKNRC